MTTNFILAAAGFGVTFLLLFYFAAKFREAAADEGSFEAEVPAVPQQEPEKTQASVASAVKRASIGPYGVMSLEIEDLKEKLKDMHYRNEELRLLSENRAAEILKAVSKLEARLNTFEEEYVKKLQPTLVSLIEDLENLKTDKTGG